MLFQSQGSHYHTELVYSKSLGCWVIHRLIVDRSGDQTWETYQLGKVLTLTMIQWFNHEVRIAQAFGSW